MLCLIEQHHKTRGVKPQHHSNTVLLTAGMSASISVRPLNVVRASTVAQRRPDVKLRGLFEACLRDADGLCHAREGNTNFTLLPSRSRVTCVRALRLHVEESLVELMGRYVCCDAMPDDPECCLSLTLCQQCNAMHRISSNIEVCCIRASSAAMRGNVEKKCPCGVQSEHESVCLWMGTNR